MAHRFEPASSSRAKCRGCGEGIAAGELRFGESLPNPFGDGEMTLWFHLDCAAFKRPEPFLETLEGRSEPLEGHERLVAEAQQGIAHRRLPRIDGAGRAPTGRAQCRSCRAPIDKGAWRIALVFYEEGRFDLPKAEEDLRVAFEMHSVAAIRRALDAGADPFSPIRGKSPVHWLVEMYTRSRRFPDSLRLLRTSLRQG